METALGSVAVSSIAAYAQRLMDRRTVQSADNGTVENVEPDDDTHVHLRYEDAREHTMDDAKYRPDQPIGALRGA
jgi:hypothetical protein